MQGVFLLMLREIYQFEAMKVETNDFHCDHFVLTGQNLLSFEKFLAKTTFRKLTDRIRKMEIEISWAG